MELAPAGVPLSFEVTFDNNALDVGMVVYDTTSSPVLVSGPTAMTLVAGTTYAGNFTGTANKCYTVIKSVYTDNTLTSLNPAYLAGSESVRSDDIAGIFLNAILASYTVPGSVGVAIANSGGGGTAGLGSTQAIIANVIVNEQVQATIIAGAQIVAHIEGD